MASIEIAIRVKVHNRPVTRSENEAIKESSQLVSKEFNESNKKKKKQTKAAGFGMKTERSRTVLVAERWDGAERLNDGGSEQRWGVDEIRRLATDQSDAGRWLAVRQRHLRQR